MEIQDRIAYRQLKAGFELPCRSYEIKAAMIDDYLEAVNENGSPYQKSNIRPQNRTKTKNRVRSTLMTG